jgi:hypothetical protein
MLRRRSPRSSSISSKSTMCCLRVCSSRVSDLRVSRYRLCKQPFRFDRTPPQGLSAMRRKGLRMRMTRIHCGPPLVLFFEGVAASSTGSETRQANAAPHDMHPPWPCKPIFSPLRIRNGSRSDPRRLPKRVCGQPCCPWQ